MQSVNRGAHWTYGTYGTCGTCGTYGTCGTCGYVWYSPNMKGSIKSVQYSTKM